MKEKTKSCTGLFTKTSFTVVRSPKWLAPLNNLARLFGLMVMPIGKPVLLSKVIANMTFKDEMKGVI